MTSSHGGLGCWDVWEVWEHHPCSRARLCGPHQCQQPACCLGNTSCTAARCRARLRGCRALPWAGNTPGRADTEQGVPFPGGGFAGQQELLWQGQGGMQGLPSGCRWLWDGFCGEGSEGWFWGRTERSIPSPGSDVSCHAFCSVPALARKKKMENPV